MKKRTQHKKRHYAIKPLAILAAWCLSGFAIATPSPFSTLPLHLKTRTDVVFGGKPRVLFVIDNTDSLTGGTVETEGYTGGFYHYKKTYAHALRESLMTTLNLPEYKNKFQLGLMFYGPASFWPDGEFAHLSKRGGLKIEPGELEWSKKIKQELQGKTKSMYEVYQHAWKTIEGTADFAIPHDKFIDYISRFDADFSKTYIGSRYLDALYLMRHAIDRGYRCEKNFIINITDGYYTGIGNTVQPAPMLATQDQFRTYTNRLDFPYTEGSVMPAPRRPQEYAVKDKFGNVNVSNTENIFWFDHEASRVTGKYYTYPLTNRAERERFASVDFMVDQGLRTRNGGISSNLSQRPLMYRGPNGYAFNSSAH